MIIDTSALIAILFNEPEAASFTRTIHNADVRRLSVVSHVELFLVLESQAKAETVRQAEAFIRAADITIEPVTVEQGTIARQAYYDFGKRRHRAKLNFGDCFSYALARATNEPLLCKGNDFNGTDVALARSN